MSKSKGGGGTMMLAVAVGLVLASKHPLHLAAYSHPASHASGPSAAAIAYAEAQIGKSYVWGGTGPGGFDCSGLTMRAEQAAGISIPRTSQQQWAGLRHVGAPVRGDLVFFAGGDGTWSAPGHVGLVLGPHVMVEAYAPGVPIRYAHFGDSQSAPGDGNPVGFADPAAS